MSKTQKIVVGLLLVAALALTAAPAMAGGGQAPPPPGLVFTPSKQLSVTIMLDPHNNSTSPGQGVIVLRRKGYKEVEALFVVPNAFGSLGPLALGCDLSLTDGRFVNRNPAGTFTGQYAPMDGYILDPVVNWLFLQVDITTGPALQPGISQVTSQQCIQQTPDSTVTAPGYLLLEGDIGFWAVPGAPVPK